MPKPTTEERKRQKASYDRQRRLTPEAKLVRSQQACRRYAEMRGRLATVKLASGCLDCGWNGHPDALDFDHVSGEKVCDLSHLVTRTWSVIAAELMKCEVVCSNCHRIRTATRREAVLASA